MNTKTELILNEYLEIQEAKGPYRIVVDFSATEMPKEELIEWGHLLSAAPDLLAAAKHIMEIFNHPTKSVSIFDGDILQKAINKALNIENE